MRLASLAMVAAILAGCGAATTPAPAPTPTPVPTESPSELTDLPTAPVISFDRPIPAPVTSETVNVPAIIDASGSTDASAALNAWIATVPDGSVISFPPGGTFRLTAGIQLTNRHNLVLEGNGATLRPTGQLDTQVSSAFALWGHPPNTDIVIRNFTIIGQNTDPGRYHGATNENRFGVLIYGGSRVEVANVTMLNTWSDYVEVAPRLTGSGDQIPAEQIWIHDNSLTGGGRMGIAVISAMHVLIERNTFDLTAGSTLDIEPNADCAAGVGWVTFRDNVILRGGSMEPSFVAANGYNAIHDVTITGNKTNGRLATDITMPRRTSIVFTNNTAQFRAYGPVLTFAHVDGLTVTGNVQPLISGPLASITDSTDVIYEP